MGKIGCMADGMHAECRFCAKKPFDDIPCPGPIEPPEDQCTFPLRGEPTIGYYWDETCENGKLGCWADGLHAECRFCGSSVYHEIPCPNATATGSSASAAASTGKGGAGTAEKQYGAATASQAYMRATSLKSVAKDISASAGEQSEGDTQLLNGAALVAPSLAALVGLLASLSASLASSL